MRLLSVDGAATRPLVVVGIGAHADDLEIGCGGTLRLLVERHPGSTVHWWVVTGEEARAAEARRAAQSLLGDACHLEIHLTGFRDGYLPSDIGRVKEAFDAFRHGRDPDVIFTHTLGDRHQDHRLIADLTWNTWRDHLILEYEIPKWDGDLPHPNVYVPLDEDRVKRKLDVLQSCFPTQQSKDWYDETTFRALLRLRGVECRAPSGWAEAFVGRKLAVIL